MTAIYCTRCSPSRAFATGRALIVHVEERHPPLERDVQCAVMALYRSCGFTAWNLAQGFRPGGKRHGTTRQAKGLPDLFLTHPARGLLVAHEVKRPGGMQSPEQRTFQVHWEAAGQVYVVGGEQAALDYLRARGLVP